MKLKGKFRVGSVFALLVLCLGLMICGAAQGAEESGTLSQFAVRFEATYGELAELADSKLPLRIDGRETYSQGPLSGNVRYVVTRKGRPVVRRMGDRVAMDVPLYFTATFSSGVGIPVSANADGELVATVISRPRLTPDWRVATDPEVRIAWRKPPAVNMMGFRVSFQPVADRVLNDWVAQRKGRLDVILNEKLNLRRRADELWRALSKPVPIGEGDILWLVARPEQFWASPLQVTSKGILMSAGLDARMRVVGGAFPGRPSVAPLPNLSSGAGDGTFRVILPATIHYAFVNSLIAKNWTPRDIRMPDGGVARLERFGMTGRQDRFVLGAQLIGTDGKGSPFDSVINFVGRPSYDVATRTVAIEDLQVESDGALAFLNDSVIPALRDVLRFPIGDQLDQLSQGLQGALSGLSYGGARLDFRPTSFGVIGVSADSQGMHAKVQAQGTVTVSLK